MLYNAMSNHLQNDNETEYKEKHTNTNSTQNLQQLLFEIEIETRSIPRHNPNLDTDLAISLHNKENGLKIGIFPSKNMTVITGTF